MVCFHLLLRERDFGKLYQVRCCHNTRCRSLCTLCWKKQKCFPFSYTCQFFKGSCFWQWFRCENMSTLIVCFNFLIVVERWNIFVSCCCQGVTNRQPRCKWMTWCCEILRAPSMVYLSCHGNNLTHVLLLFLCFWSIHGSGFLLSWSNHLCFIIKSMVYGLLNLICIFSSSFYLNNWTFWLHYCLNKCILFVCQTWVCFLHVIWFNILF